MLCRLSYPGSAPGRLITCRACAETLARRRRRLGSRRLRCELMCGGCANCPGPGHNDRVTTRAHRMATAVVVTGAVAVAGWAIDRRRTRRRALRLDGATVAAVRGGSFPAAEGSLPGKATAVATLASEWVRDTAARMFGWRNGDEAEDAITKDVANELAQILATYGERVHADLETGAAGPHRHLVAQASSR